MPDSSAPTETLGSAGEGAALARILARLPRADGAIVGPGDDAAVMRAPDGRYVVTTDTMIQGPDFRLAWSTFYDLGWKAAVTNLSDVAAMGAMPTALVIALATPAATALTDLESFADGVREACDQHAPGCALVGGDLSVSDTVTIAVTAFGDLDGADPVLRSGASPGDVLAVCGVLGLAGAGIALLFAEAVDRRDGGVLPSRERAAALWVDHRPVLQAQLRPTSPIGAGPDAARAGATAMMDVSDGLLLDATRLARASGVVLDLDAQAVAAEAASLTGLEPGVRRRDAVRFVLSGGEDHALLATFPPGADLPSGWRAIGVARERAGSEVQVLLGGNPVDLDVHGWDPYRAWDGVGG